MIIVEGPDGAGKTTLIKDLSKYLDLPVAPRVVSKDTEAMTDLRVWVEDNTSKGFQRTLFDRYRLISELIYGPILRGEAEPPFNELSWLTWQMSNFYAAKPFIIYCLPPMGTVLSNIYGNEDNKIFWQGTSAWKIYNMYTSQAARDVARDPWHTFIWDYTRDGLEKNPMSVFRPIKQYLEEHHG